MTHIDPFGSEQNVTEWYERLRCPECGLPTIPARHEDIAPSEALCDQCAMELDTVTANG